MAFEQRENSGVLFQNDKKEKPTQPDFRGEANVDGRKYKLSLWVKTTKNGDDFYSLSFTPIEQQ